MHEEDYESILYRIFSGYYTINIDNKDYKIISPTILIKNQAHKLYLDVLDEYKYDITSWISKKAINHLLKTYNIWDDTKEKLLEEGIKDLDKIKIQLYLNFNNSLFKNEIKNKIVSINNSINNLYIQKHHFDYLTLDYYAKSIKSQFIITQTILDFDNKPIFDFQNFDSIDTGFLEKIINPIQENIIDISTIKKIARSEIWKSFWGISKERVFEGKVKDWIDEQRSLVNFSKLLDNVREHMEAPSEDIIADDDALDGWILYQHEKNTKEKKKKEITDKYDLNNKGAGEVFLITDDAEEAKTIFGLNNEIDRRNIRQIHQVVEEKGEVKWSELPFVQQQLKQQVNRK